MNEMIFLGLGSNLGDRLRNMERAIESLGRICDIHKTSSIYETEPFGVTTTQPKYLNQVLKIETDLNPENLITEILIIEHDLGRGPHKTGESRIIDIDILMYGILDINEHSLSYNLVIPHPRLDQRAFVLVPILEICPDLCHPTKKMPLKHLLKGLDTSGISLMEGNQKSLKNLTQ